MLIKDIPLNERPRERVIKYGVNNVSNEDLLSIILKTGTKDMSVKDLSDLILKEINDISNLKYISLNTLTKIKGIGLTKAITLISAIELGKRVYTDTNYIKKKITNSKDIYDIFSYLKYEKQEYFYVLYLDNKKQVISNKLLFKGTINRSITHPREIFKEAYLDSASYIVCIHNHPSGDVTPSMEDVDITNKLIEIGKLNNIPILDHIIIGDGFYSFYEEKYYD